MGAGKLGRAERGPGALGWKRHSRSRQELGACRASVSAPLSCPRVSAVLRGAAGRGARSTSVVRYQGPLGARHLPRQPGPRPAASVMPRGARPGKVQGAGLAGPPELEGLRRPPPRPLLSTQRLQAAPATCSLPPAPVHLEGETWAGGECRGFSRGEGRGGRGAPPRTPGGGQGTPRRRGAARRAGQATRPRCLLPLRGGGGPLPRGPARARGGALRRPASCGEVAGRGWGAGPGAPPALTWRSRRGAGRPAESGPPTPAGRAWSPTFVTLRAV